MTRYLWIFIIVLVIIVAVLPKISNAEKMKEKSEIIQLSKPKLDGEISVEEAISKRRSIRSYARRELTLEQISRHPWAAMELQINLEDLEQHLQQGRFIHLKSTLQTKMDYFIIYPRAID